MAYWHDHGVEQLTEEDCYLFSFSSEMHSLGRGGTDVAMVFKQSPRQDMLCSSMLPEVGYEHCCVPLATLLWCSALLYIMAALSKFVFDQLVLGVFFCCFIVGQDMCMASPRRAPQSPRCLDGGGSPHLTLPLFCDPDLLSDCLVNDAGSIYVRS